MLSIKFQILPIIKICLNLSKFLEKPMALYVFYDIIFNFVKKKVVS